MGPSTGSVPPLHPATLHVNPHRPAAQSVLVVGAARRPTGLTAAHPSGRAASPSGGGRQWRPAPHPTPHGRPSPLQTVGAAAWGRPARPLQPEASPVFFATFPPQLPPLRAPTGRPGTAHCRLPSWRRSAPHQEVTRQQVTAAASAGVCTAAPTGICARCVLHSQSRPEPERQRRNVACGSLPHMWILGAGTEQPLGTGCYT